jgi:hypothetical protein
MDFRLDFLYKEGLFSSFHVLFCQKAVGIPIASFGLCCPGLAISGQTAVGFKSWKAS